MAFRRRWASVGLVAFQEPKGGGGGGSPGGPARGRRRRGKAGKGVPGRAFPSPQTPLRWRKAGARRLAPPRPPPSGSACARRAFPCPPCFCLRALRGAAGAFRTLRVKRSAPLSPGASVTLPRYPVLPALPMPSFSPCPYSPPPFSLPPPATGPAFPPPCKMGQMPSILG